MNRLAAACLLVSMGLGMTACNGGGSSATPAALNLAGTWTVTTVSTQGHETASGTATITQAGTGLGVNGATTLAAGPAGQIVISQNGTALTGAITSSLQKVTYNFTGSLANGTLTATGSIACSATVNESVSIAGSIMSNSAQGTYTITRGSGCYYPNDAGTFTATKK